MMCHFNYSDYRAIKTYNCRKIYIVVFILFFLAWSFINVNSLSKYLKRVTSFPFDSVDVSVAEDKLKSTDLKRANVNFNNFVIEKDNIAEEEVENYLTNSGNEITGFNSQLDKDVNAAVEVHSNEHFQMPGPDDKQNLSWPILSAKSFSVIQLNNELEKFVSDNFESSEFHVWSKSYLEAKGAWNYGHLTSSEIADLSVLGRRLFLHEDIGQLVNKTFLINVYKYGLKLENRLIKHYTSKKNDPFNNCSVKNCKLSYKDEDFHKADAVLFHLHQMEAAPSNIIRKNYQQRWVWMSDESPFNTFLLAKDRNIDHYDGLFNWSMTYRSTSDVPVPYGRTVPVFSSNTYHYNDIFSMKYKSVAIMGSNCGGRNKRWHYVKKLMKYIDVDTYGRCGQLKCPGHYFQDCDLLRSYKFYLAFENSNCLEYITEKAWWNAFAKYSVPVIMGSSKNDYMKLFPPDSFIYVEDFDTPKDLAEYIQFLASNRDAYNKYHEWRKHFAVLNEHGYFQTEVFHYCRLCEALNYNSPEHKTYYSLKAYWNASRDCYPAKWPQKML